MKLKEIRWEVFKGQFYKPACADDVREPQGFPKRWERWYNAFSCPEVARMVTDIQRARAVVDQWFDTPPSGEDPEEDLVAGILRVIEETREEADERLKMSCPDCQAIAPENEKDWPNTECVVCVLRAEVERLRAALMKLALAAKSAEETIGIVMRGEAAIAAVALSGAADKLSDALAAAEKAVKP